MFPYTALHEETHSVMYEVSVSGLRYNNQETYDYLGKKVSQ